MNVQLTQIFTSFRSFPPAPTEACRRLTELFADFELAEYIEVLRNSNGLGEVVEAGGERFVHNMLVLPADEAIEESKRLFEGKSFVFGRSGIDGISFTLLPGDSAVFAYYPIDAEYVRISDSLTEFLEGWRANKIRL